MDENNFVKFDTAMLAKHAGFNWNVMTSYFIGDVDQPDIKVGSFNWDCAEDKSYLIAAPSLVTLHKWLIEVKQLVVTIEVYAENLDIDNIKYNYRIHYKNSEWTGNYKDYYYVALEDGLRKGLKILLEK